MYTIKQAAVRSGVSVPLLRAWERRYGVVRPDRTASGYRLYDDADIARLRAVRRLVEQGWTPSTAAAAVAGMDDPAIAELSEAAGPVAGAAVAAGSDLVTGFAAAAASRDGAALDEILDRMFAAGTFEFVCEHYLMPALVELGRAWEAGRVDVAAEHAASHAVLRRLGTAFEAAGSTRQRGAPILVGLPPGAQHQLGALAFGVAARRSGLPVVYEGPDLPVTDWVEAAVSLRARGAVVGVVTEADQAATRQVVAELHAARPDLLVAVGGRGASGIDPGPHTVRLPDELTAAVDALKAALR